MEFVFREKKWSLFLGEKTLKLMVGLCFSELKSRQFIGWSLPFSEQTYVIDEIWSLILGEKIVGVCF